jgi:tetratricopeptide (TPR) repeat protein
MQSPAARIFLSFTLLAALAQGQEHHHQEEAVAVQGLGSVSFPISCPAGEQQEFNRGVALLHSFSYKNARLQFQQIVQRDSSCAMAYWGEAMSLYRQLWDRPTANDLAEGLKLMEQAKPAPIKTDRERAYIDAANAFYSGGAAATYESRQAAYSAAMKRVHERWPQDDEASLFYALSLLASPDSSKNNFAIARQAVAIISGVFARQPDHPGAAHYLIHACDNPVMAVQALAAAKRYAQIAPASPHAVHMPSHIFARLGMWDEDIQSNLASVKIAREQKSFPDMLHAMNFLEYAYLQKGEFNQAKQIEMQALAVPKEQLTDMQGMFNYVRVRFPSLYLLETRDWKAAQSMPVPEDAEPDFQAVVYWTRAVASGHLRDSRAAQAAVASYDAKLEEVRKSSFAYVADSMRGERDEAHAWLAFAKGDTQTAIKLLSAVADSQDREGKGEVELPAREMLADVLLAAGRPSDGLTQYQRCLRTDPNRLNSVLGAKRAAQATGQGLTEGIFNGDPEIPLTGIQIF